jgi:Tfp pilus assembly protein PilO
MRKPDINYFYWLLGRYSRALGFWGLLGVGIIVGCIMFYMATIRELQQDIKTIQSEVDHSKNNTNEVVQPQALPAQTSAQEMNEFYKRFPAGSSLPKWLHLIDQTAVNQHLVLNRGDYRFSQTKQGQLLRYEIVLPLIGKYTQVHQFVVEVLQKIPALALSDLQIKRENSLSPTVEARLVFVLFLKGDAW